MLYMVVELFKPDRLADVESRFSTEGRMLPEGVEYCASWIEPDGSRCFQLMQASSRDALELWASRWSDLVDIEIIEVKTSQQFWANR